MFNDYIMETATDETSLKKKICQVVVACYDPDGNTWAGLIKSHIYTELDVKIREIDYQVYIMRQRRQEVMRDLLGDASTDSVAPNCLGILSGRIHNLEKQLKTLRYMSNRLREIAEQIEKGLTAGRLSD